MIKKRSVLIDGQPSSVSIEDAFWKYVVQIAGERGQSISSLVTSVTSTCAGNRSSALRLFVLNHLEDAVDTRRQEAAE